MRKKDMERHLQGNLTEAVSNEENTNGNTDGQTKIQQGNSIIEDAQFTGNVAFLKKSLILYVVLFIALIGGIGIASQRNLIKFYVDGEVDYNEWTVSLGSKFETDVASSFFEKFEFVKLNGAVRNLLGQHAMNGVVKLNNGHLMTPMTYVDDETLQSRADRVAAYSKALKERGTDLLFVMTPCSVGKYDSQLPTGTEDFSNDNADRLVQMLKEGGVDTIDFRDEMYEDGIDHYDMMYKTDHHWTTEAGLYAYGKIEDYIVDKTGCKTDARIREASSYTIDTYENWHLGSFGQRVGNYYAGTDDFSLYLPNFKTKLQNADGKTGTLQDLVYNMEPLEEKNETSRYTYDWVLEKSLGDYKNLEAPNDVKLLIITDSFGKAVNPYLMMGFSEIRYCYDQSVASITPEYIKEYDPDVVILLYYLGNAVSSEEALDAIYDFVM